jgi:hypothetical protein
MSATPSLTDEKQDLKEVRKKRFSFKKTKNVLDEKQHDDAASGSTAVQAPPDFLQSHSPASSASAQTSISSSTHSASYALPVPVLPR